MSRWSVLVFAAGVLAGTASSALVGLASSRPAASAPGLGDSKAQPAPPPAYKVEFEKPYDLYCTFRQEPTLYRSCMILGFTGGSSSGAASSSGGGSFSFSSGSGAYEARHFDHWLALRLSDGRHAFIPPAAVESIEEARPAAE